MEILDMQKPEDIKRCVTRTLDLKMINPTGLLFLGKKSITRNHERGVVFLWFLENKERISVISPIFLVHRSFTLKCLYNLCTFRIITLFAA